MRELVVLGGYGYLGRRCLRELASRSAAPLVVAGRSVQRAEELSLGLGERARATYCDALDPRTLRRVLESAMGVVVCCGRDVVPAITAAISLRVPLVATSNLALDARSRRVLGEAAWKAQVPIVVQAGALPGLPGALAEVLVRRLPSILELRIASTGPWRGTETARLDARASRVPGWRQIRWRFAEPVGPRWVRAADTPDLEGFAEGHCVERLSYLEPPEQGLLARAFERIAGPPPLDPFALCAEAWLGGGQGPAARIELTAADVVAAAAAVTGSLVEAILAREVPAGLLTPREAVSPGRILRDLEKSGARISGLDD